MVKVHLYRPFSAKHLLAAIPASLQRRLPFSTAPRSPVPWASRCTRMSCAALFESGRMD